MCATVPASALTSYSIIASSKLYCKGKEGELGPMELHKCGYGYGGMSVSIRESDLFLRPSPLLIPADTLFVLEKKNT